MSAPATARLLAALELLQAHRRVTGAELAARLEVDRRTVRRYVARLASMGVPIDADRGRDGAYRLSAGYKLPPMMFSDDEALALAMGLVAARGLGLGPPRIAVDSALAKLERVMPEALRLRVRSVGRTVRLDLRSAQAPVQGGTLAVLSEAIEKQQRLQLRYRAAAGPDAAAPAAVERLFDPYGLAYYIGHWYAVGHCHLRRGQRTFRVDRIEALLPVAASFAPPPAFDALVAVREAVARVPRAHAVEVDLRLAIDEARSRLDPEVGLLQSLPGRGPPRVRLTGSVDDLDWFARELAALPCRFEIRHPAALVRVVERHARRLLAGAVASRALVAQRGSAKNAPPAAARDRSNPTRRRR